MIPAERLIQLARTLEAELQPAATSDEITKTEKRLGYPLPQDLRELYLRSNGVFIHDNMWNFPPLAELSLIQEYRSDPADSERLRSGGETLIRDLLFLCDALIDAPTYWIRIDPKAVDFGHIYCDGDYPWWRSANCFDEFISRLESDPDEIHIGYDDP